MGKHPQADLYVQERMKGKTYAQIAKEYGVCYQTVWNACKGMQSGRFRAWTKERCIYPNLRKWLNDNRVSLDAFVVRMGCINSGQAAARFSDYLRGRCNPTKKVIDGMLRVTGLTYEQMWERDDE